MISYLIEVSFCWLGFYLLYILLFSKETFFRTNRSYLLSSLLIGLGLPFLSFLPEPVMVFSPESLATSYIQPLHQGVQQLEEIVVMTSRDQTPVSARIFCTVYFIGVLVFGSRLLYGLGQIFQLYRSARIIKKDGYYLALSAGLHYPFSFFKILFWSEAVEFKHRDGSRIIQHELAHIKSWHSLDILLIELLSVIFWCSPLIYFFTDNPSE